MTERVVLTGYHDVIAAYRNRDLRQALFDLPALSQVGEDTDRRFGVAVLIDHGG